MIVGRSDVQATIRGLLDEARDGRGAALCLTGEAGIGKSTLLRWAEETADFTVLHTRGVEDDLDLPYGSLLDVVTPVRDRLTDVHPRGRAALESTLGWGPALDVSRHLLSGAVLALLAEAARPGPVLVVVDDLQWVDRESAQALAFAARRLRLDPVGFLLAARDADSAVPFEATVIELGGLDAADAGEVLCGAQPQVAALLAGVTGGNPLALLEAQATLTPAQLRGSAPLPEIPPLGRLRETLVVAQASLSEPARRASTLIAAAHDSTAGCVVAVLQSEGIDPDTALGEVEAAGLIEVGRQVEFKHPLHRAAVWSLAAPAERRSAHRTWANVSALPDRVSLRHRIEGALGFDDRLSVRVERLVRDRDGTTTLAESRALLESAAALSSSPARAARLLADAADTAWLAGDNEHAATLAKRARQSDDLEARSRALLTLGLIEEYAGVVPDAQRLLREAAAAAAGLTRVRALADLVLVGYRLGDAASMAEAAAQLVAVADPADHEQRMLSAYMSGAAAAYGGDWEAARAPMAEALDLLERDPLLREDPRHMVLALTAGVWMGEPERALEFMDRRMQVARDVGALGVLPFALTLLAGGHMLLGQHWRGFAYADEALRLGRELGHVVEVSTAQELLAWQYAARGRHDDAREAVRDARRLGARAGVADGAVQVDLVDAHAALCRGEPARTIMLLEKRLALDNGRMPNGDYELAVAPDLTEAYLALGRNDEARDLATRHASLHERSPSPLARVHTYRLWGMTTPSAEEAEEAFARAHLAHELWPDPWEAGRTRLQHGARLRRHGDRRAARRELAEAGRIFTELGFTTWQERVEQELAASGSRASRGTGRQETLTAQEARVAMLVAEGLTNREIAASLYLSPKTIEHHVSAALRKTGARSRTELGVVVSSGAPH